MTAIELGVWPRRAVWGAFLVVLAIGCNPITTASFLLHSPKKQPAEVALKPHKDPTTGKLKDEVRVVVLCGMSSAGSGADAMAFAGADRELASLITKKFPGALTYYECKEKIVVVSTAQVDKFKMSNPGWKTMHPAAIGRKLGADYVLDVHLGRMQVYEPGSANMIYQGLAEVSVDVYDSTAKDREPTNKHVHSFKYPRGPVEPAEGKPLSRFKLEFMDTLATELILRHIEHPPGDGIAGGGDLGGGR